MEIPKLDQRNKEDFIQQIQQLAKSYLPQWQFNSHNPDMGSVAALIFAGMMQDVVERYNRTAEKNMVEFFRHLGASPLQLEPARSYVQCSVSGMPENVPGEFLPEGVQVLAQTSAASEEGENLVFSIQQPLYAVNSRLRHVFYENTKKDWISHCYEGEENSQGERIRLFEEQGINLQSHVLSIWAGECMDLRSGSTFALSFEFEDTEPELIRRFLAMFKEGAAQVTYSTETGFRPALFQESTGSTLVLKLSQELPAPTVLEGIEGYWISLRFSLLDIPQKIYLKGVKVSSQGEKWRLDGVFNEISQLKTNHFQPFDTNPIPYTSVYFASDCLLHKPGATVKLEFYLDYHREPIQEAVQQDIEWKHIMKKSKLEKPKEYDVSILSVVWEYYNGFGWVRLFEDDRYSDVFDGTNDGTMVCVTFNCPADLQQAFLPSGEMRCIRARIASIKNYLKQNGYYVVPIVSQPVFSYWYLDTRFSPYLVRENCLERKLSKRQERADSIRAAYGSPTVGQAVYFCFDAPLNHPMIRLLFVVGKENASTHTSLYWEYGAEGGFQALSCQDDTQGLSKTGLLSLQKNESFVPLTLFGQTGYWLRARTSGDREKGPMRLEKLCLNTVWAINLRQQDYEYFRIDAKEERVCRLRNPDIYRASVYVDELSQTSPATAERWIAEKKAEGQWNSDGTMIHLWVLWEEIDDIQRAEEGQRCYQLDRDQSLIRFGNGLAGRVPPESEEENVRVAYTVGGGRKGNLPVGAISMADRNLGMISQVINPLPSFGGQDRETLDQTLKRSSAALRCFGRACTAFDYEWAVRMTQRDILKIKCLSCVNGQGQRQYGAVTLVLLFEDMDHFEDNCQRIRRQLLTLGCGGLQKEQLFLVPPTFLVYHITGEVVVTDDRTVAAAQKETAEIVRAYFDPISGGNDRQGWQIGQIPNRMMLRNLLDNHRAVVRIDQFTLRVCLENGEELTESRLNQLEEQGMALAVAGEIHIDVRVEHSIY
ncbi:baseplate J/gp47 family protein [Angelakisella massiliensis]|uniref:baseplate J/gp47 family protein n=1 Tax=Angelakisella massiliensis TaxID=1871018 RepID=UPI0023A7D762|nr:baseplate J/gp47 family protein [Angelakisella massiliensis]